MGRGPRMLAASADQVAIPSEVPAVATSPVPAAGAQVDRGGNRARWLRQPVATGRDGSDIQPLQEPV